MKIIGLSVFGPPFAELYILKSFRRYGQFKDYNEFCTNSVFD